MEGTAGDRDLIIIQYVDICEVSGKQKIVSADRRT